MMVVDTSQKARWIVLFVFSLITALYLSIWWVPERSTLEPVNFDAGWITGDSERAKRGYFRSTVDVEFMPRQAWVALVTEDYSLYVNGVEVAYNHSATNPSNAIQQAISDPAQSLSSGNTIPMVRTPDLQKLPNDESIFTHLIDVSPFMVEGKNVFALYVQSSQAVRFAIKGEIIGDERTQYIDSSPAAWRSSSVENIHSHYKWVSNDYIDATWSVARSGGALQEMVFATVPVEMMTAPWSFIGATGDVTIDELRIKRSLIPVTSEPPSPFTSENAWLRLYSSWPYSLFIDDEYISQGGGRGVEAIDLSSYIARGAQQLSLRLERPVRGDEPRPLFAAEGVAGVLDLSTPGSWKFLIGDHPDWLQGAGQWQMMEASHQPVMPKGMRASYIPSKTLSWYSRFIWVWGASLLLMAVLIGVLGRSARYLQNVSPGYTPPSALAVMSVPITALLSVVLLKVRLQESDNLIHIINPLLTDVWLWLGPVILLLTLMLFLPRQGVYDQGLKKVTSGLASIDPRLWLLFILCIGFILRTFNIGYEALQADENVSWDAARGILRTGAPESTSGIYYTRSPLYHYLLAGWLWLFGDTIAMARLYSVLPGVAVLVAVYYLVLAMTKRHSLALICAFLLAIDPWQINMSRNIRFYQQLQLFGVITTLFFLRGFIWKEGKRYQNLFFASCLAAVLSQEVFVITFPAFCIAGLYYYRSFSWSRDRNVWIGFITMMSLTIIDMAVFSIVCLTPHVGIATSSGSIMQLHLLNVLGFYNTFLYGNARVSMLYCIVFLAGIFYWARYPNKAIVVLYLLVILTLFTVTVLVMQIANRYVFCLYPAFIIISVLSADALLAKGREYIFSSSSGGISGAISRRWQAIMVVMLLCLMVINVEPGRLLDSYESNRNYQHQQALEFIATQRAEGDKLVTVHPMPAAIVFKQLDYYLMESISFDEVFMSDQGIIDRWSGGKLISKIEQLHRVMQQNERVWIVMDDYEKPKFSDEMLTFIIDSTRVEYEFFGGKVYLWERDAGKLAWHHDRDGTSDSY